MKRVMIAIISVFVLSIIAHNQAAIADPPNKEAWEAEKRQMELEREQRKHREEMQREERKYREESEREQRKEREEMDRERRKREEKWGGN